MNIDENDKIEIIESSFSIGDLTEKMFGKSNGEYRKKAIDFMNKNGYDVLFFKNKNKNTKYEKIEKKCQICESIFITRLNHKREKMTCSISCSNSLKPKRKLIESTYKKKNSITIKKKYDKLCIVCGQQFNGTKKAKSCSKKCMGEIIRRKMNERVILGKHKGWVSRNIESYPESFFKKVLFLNKIEYKFNFPILKRTLGVNESLNYFLDFFIQVGDKKIDLEIDGGQHEIDERKQSDLRRDELLTRNGYIVYRIKWKNPKNELNKLYIKNEIDKFLNFIKALE